MYDLKIFLRRRMVLEEVMARQELERRRHHLHPEKCVIC